MNFTPRELVAIDMALIHRVIDLELRIKKFEELGHDTSADCKALEESRSAAEKVLKMILKEE
ncbi:hypothetical protein D3C74_431650 [compost metagenome]